MAALTLTTISTLKTYFNALAVSHVDIDALKFGDEDVIQNANRSDMSPKTLWVQEYETFNFDDQLIDNIQIRKEIKLLYMKVAASEKFSDLQAAKEECEIVMKQVVAKMLKDKATLVFATQVSNWSGKVGYWDIGSTKYCGCEITMQIRDNAGLVYDAAKWG